MTGLLKRAQGEEGDAVDIAPNGQEAVWLGTENDYGAIVLDLMLPDIDGFEVCPRLRAAGQWHPVLVLTARDAIHDRVAGLDRGADDYLPSPSRSRSFMRDAGTYQAGGGERPTVPEVDDLTLDPATRRVWRHQRC